MHKVSLSYYEDPFPEGARPLPDFSPPDPQFPTQADVDKTAPGPDDAADVGNYQDPLAQLKRDTDYLAFPEPLETEAPGRPDAPTSTLQSSGDPPCRGSSPTREAFEADYAKQARIILDPLRQTRAAARAEQSAGSSEFTAKTAYTDQVRSGPGATLTVARQWRRYRTFCVRTRRPIQRSRSLISWNLPTHTSAEHVFVPEGFGTIVVQPNTGGRVALPQSGPLPTGQRQYPRMARPRASHPGSFTASGPGGIIGIMSI